MSTPFDQKIEQIICAAQPLHDPCECTALLGHYLKATVDDGLHWLGIQPTELNKRLHEIRLQVEEGSFDYDALTPWRPPVAVWRLAYALIEHCPHGDRLVREAACHRAIEACFQTPLNRPKEAWYPIKPTTTLSTEECLSVREQFNHILNSIGETDEPRYASTE